jgi:hypothetical protein
MALRIALLRSPALQNDRLYVPVILQCRPRQETNPKGHWVPNYFVRNSPLNGGVDLLAGSDALSKMCVSDSYTGLPDVTPKDPM